MERCVHIYETILLYILLYELTFLTTLIVINPDYVRLLDKKLRNCTIYYMFYILLVFCFVHNMCTYISSYQAYLYCRSLTLQKYLLASIFSCEY